MRERKVNKSMALEQHTSDSKYYVVNKIQINLWSQMTLQWILSCYWITRRDFFFRKHRWFHPCQQEWTWQCDPREAQYYLLTNHTKPEIIFLFPSSLSLCTYPLSSIWLAVTYLYNICLPIHPFIHPSQTFTCIVSVIFVLKLQNW